MNIKITDKAKKYLIRHTCNSIILDMISLGSGNC